MGCPYLKLLLVGVAQLHVDRVVLWEVLADDVEALAEPHQSLLLIHEVLLLQTKVVVRDGQILDLQLLFLGLLFCLLQGHDLVREGHDRVLGKLPGLLVAMEMDHSLSP